MKKITFLMNKYRECARNLWNVYLLDHEKMNSRWDILDQYDKICTNLFSIIVLSPLGQDSYKKSYSYEKYQEPLSFIHIVPSNEAPIRINRDVKPSGYWDYFVKTLSPNDAELCFIDYFDFDVLGFRNFEYYRIRIQKSCNKDIIGRDALINTKYVDVYYK